MREIFEQECIRERSDPSIHGFLRRRLTVEGTLLKLHDEKKIEGAQGSWPGALNLHVSKKKY